MDWNWVKDAFELTRKKESEYSIDSLARKWYSNDRKVAGIYLRSFSLFQENHNSIIIEGMRKILVDHQMCGLAYVFEEIEKTDDYKLQYVIYRGDKLQIIPAEEHFKKQN